MGQVCENKRATTSVREQVYENKREPTVPGGSSRPAARCQVEPAGLFGFSLPTLACARPAAAAPDAVRGRPGPAELGAEEVEDWECGPPPPPRRPFLAAAVAGRPTISSSEACRSARGHSAAALALVLCGVGALGRRDDVPSRRRLARLVAPDQRGTRGGREQERSEGRTRAAGKGGGGGGGGSRAEGPVGLPGGGSRRAPKGGGSRRAPKGGGSRRAPKAEGRSARLCQASSSRGAHRDDAPMAVMPMGQVRLQICTRTGAGTEEEEQQCVGGRRSEGGGTVDERRGRGVEEGCGADRPAEGRPGGGPPAGLARLAGPTRRGRLRRGRQLRRAAR